MAFNEQGEIIRPLTGTVSNDSSNPPNDTPDDNFWGGGVWIIAILIFMYSAAKSCSTRNTVSRTDIQTESIVAETNSYGDRYGKITFYKTTPDTSDVELKVDGEIIGRLSQPSPRTLTECDGPATVSTILPTGWHSLNATDKHGRYSSFDFVIIEGECKTKEVDLKHFQSKQLDTKLAKVLDGEWYGKAYQYGTKETLNVVFSCKHSTEDYKVSYPSLGCIGLWNIENVSGKTIHFTEHILFGKGPFSDLMEADVKIISSKKIELNYYYHNNPIVIAKVILTKL